jgi:hypothetical protein
MLPRSRSRTPTYIRCSYIGSMQKHTFRLLSVPILGEDTKKY